MSTVQIAQKYNSTMAFPRDNYVVRCTKDEFGPSSKGNAMITLEFEIDRPEEITVAGIVEDVPTDVPVNIAGVKTQPVWLVTQVIENGVLNEEKSLKALTRANEWLATAGLPKIEDPTNPQVQVKGKLFHAQVFGKTEEVRKTQTAAEKAAGKEAPILMNPVTGQPETRCIVTISKVYGPANNDQSKPY